MERKLSFQQTLTDGVTLGLQNIVNLLITMVLYLITFWIPYLNVGTSIGVYKVIIAMSKGESFSPLDIFDKENFKPIGDFFLLFGLQTAGIGAAAMFCFIPAIILGIAWDFATYFLLDKGVSPIRALKLSFDVTRGEKWTIFFIVLALVVAIMLVVFLLSLIPYVGGVLAALASICAAPIAFGVQAVMYRYFYEKAVSMQQE